MTGKAADLHMHTTASDGTDSVEERTYDAKSNGLSCIAITDHDVIGNELHGRVQEVNDVEVITGSEIKCEVDGRKIEILGYFLDPDGKNVQQMLADMREARRERMEKMVGRVNELDDIDTEIGLEEVLEKAETSVGRPHLAQTLLEKGEVDEFQAAFDLYLGEDCPAYVPTEKIAAEKVIEAVHSDGGVTSLAHPHRSLDLSAEQDTIEQLVDAGLDALEGVYQANTVDSYVERLAGEHDLLLTGGSDCHGSDSGENYLIGTVELPYSHVEELKEKRKEYAQEG